MYVEIAAEKKLGERKKKVEYPGEGINTVTIGRLSSKLLMPTFPCSSFEQGFNIRTLLFSKYNCRIYSPARKIRRGL